MAMRYFFFKNSNQQTKNLFPYAEKYVQGMGDNPYSFIHTVDELFQAFVDGDKLNIIHRLASEENFANEPYPFKTLKLREIAGLLDKNESVHLVAVNLPTNLSDQELMNKATLAVLDDKGLFLDAFTKESLTVGKPTAILLVSFFRVGPTQIYLGVMHSPFVVPTMGVTEATGMRITRIYDAEYIKNSIYPVTASSGVEAIIGGDMVFVNKPSMTFQIIDPTKINPADIDLTKIIKVEGGFEYTIDSDNGSLTIDLSSLELKTAAPLRILLDGGPYLNWWVNTSQRFVYEYMLYRTV
jgi:hypothetical protein